MPKRKQKTIAGLLEDAAKLLQRIRRIESADESGYCVCVTCGKVDHWKNMEGGHWIPRTKTATKIEPTNIHPQCNSCNHFRKEEAAPKYAQYMYNTYGKSHCDMLLDLSTKSIKRNRVTLLEIIDQHKKRLAEIE